MDFAKKYFRQIVLVSVLAIAAAAAYASKDDSVRHVVHSTVSEIHNGSAVLDIDLGDMEASQIRELRVHLDPDAKTINTITFRIDRDRK